MDTGSYREEVYETFADPGADVDAKIDRALAVGTEYLGVPIGFLTRIDGDVQEVVRATGDHELLQPGETCPLDEAYCRRTVEIDGTLAVQDAGESPAIAERAIRTFGLGTYIGTKVHANDEVYGTVCFAADDERDGAFAEAEELFVELLAELIGQALERRAYERELRERNERLEREKRRFEGIADNSFDVLFRASPDGEFTYVSSAVERVLGYTPGELVGSPLREFVAESSIDDVKTAYARVLDGDTVETLELDFRDSDGGTVVLEVNATPITDGGGVVGVQGVGRDVTDRKRRERELRMKTRAIDEARIGIVIADASDPDSPLVYVNEGFERVTGYDADEAIGRNCRFLQGPATDGETVALLRERIDAEESASVELVNYRRDGAPFWNQVRVDPVVDDGGEVTHYLGFQADVTERKRTEQLVRLLDRLLRHNLRNDMNVVIGHGSMLRDGTADVAAAGEQIVDTAEGLVELSEQARELERYAQCERDPRRLDPVTVLDDVATANRRRFPGATIDLQVRTDRGICAGVELERAMSELVANALKHDASTDPWVGIEATDDGEWIELTVEDGGPGIDRMETAVISKGTETPLEHGAGLGLWLVNWIVTRYGGSFQIRAKGKDREGSVATTRLPAVGRDDRVEDVARRPTVLFR